MKKLFFSEDSQSYYCDEDVWMMDIFQHPLSGELVIYDVGDVCVNAGASFYITQDNKLRKSVIE